MEEDRIIVLTDEDGNDVEFEVIVTMEVEGSEYAVMLPLDGSEEAVIFKIVVDEDGNEIMETVLDDEEFEAVAAAYEDLIEDMDMDEDEDEIEVDDIKH
jgi:uncharacterized protein YrzB (UPF0473 family)